ncbi:universal stress protein [Pseudofrankia asymbiotica]|uniref:Universal stress protein UspA n=1 Tax=Pseudofrankia asymbiotica TaxID=1834516 RepID=A0A1V2I9N8_9ACTN|nr:universal stress protein [Pseudofrankia asymbiotica]ONH28013.1 hypothetical protein BL253_20630 [Pseudofrankia asymbiotica]
MLAFRRSARSAPEPRASRTDAPAVLPELPPAVAGRVRVVAVVDQGERGARAFAWACGYVGRTPGAALVGVVVDTGPARFMPTFEMSCGPVVVGQMAEYLGLAEQVVALREEADHRGVEAHLAYSDDSVGAVLDAVLGEGADLVVVGFRGSGRSGLGWNPLRRLMRRGLPVVTIP